LIRIGVYTFVSFTIALIIIPLVIMLCKKYDWYDSINARKVHSGSVPRLGGIGFAPIFLIASPIYLWTLDRNLFNTYIPLIIAGFLVFLLGVFDDFYELKPIIKLMGQCVVAIIPIIFGFKITQIGPFNIGLLPPVITFFWLIGIINAFNLIDGVDALCASLALSTSIVVGVVLTIGGSEYNALPFILIGGIMGFLVYNKPKAKIFMGDGGSQFLGFVIATFPLFKTTATISYNFFLMMIILNSIPILDTFAAIWRRKREKRPFFSPDRRHLHHKLMDMGYTTKSILFFLLIIQTGLCILSLIAVLWIEGARGFIILCGALVSMLIFFTIIHYTSRTVSQLKSKSTEIDS